MACMAALAVGDDLNIRHPLFPDADHRHRAGNAGKDAFHHGAASSSTIAGWIPRSFSASTAAGAPGSR